MSISDIDFFSPVKINNFLLQLVKNILQKVAEKPQVFLAKTTRNGKDCLVIDLDSEDSFRRFAQLQFPGVKVYGEEGEQGEKQPEDLDLTNTDSICALVDMVDGTDLLERGMHNWCSSAVFFHPQLPSGSKIIAAFIAIPGSDIYIAAPRSPESIIVIPNPEVYFAEAGSPTFVVNVSQKIREAEGPAQVELLDGSSVCFYGQKLNRLRSTANRPLFDDASSKQNKNLRIYNLAGMPMIVRILDPIKDVAGINAVFDCKGQKPHDVVPGAFLAMQSKCAVLDGVTGKPMKMETLENSLMRPFDNESKLKYVIASTNKLASTIWEQLQN